MFTDLTDWALDLRELVLTAAGVVLLVATLAVGFIKRSLLAAAGTLIFGALLWWGMANSDWMRDRWGNDFDTDGAAIVQIEPRSGLFGE